jgi:hypothetical protein
MANVTELKIELEQEEDSRWIGEIPALPDVMAWSHTKAAALAAVQALALREMADGLEHSEAESPTTESGVIWDRLARRNPDQSYFAAFGGVLHSRPRRWYT